MGKIVLVRPDVDDSVRETEQNALLNDLGEQTDVTVMQDGLPFVLQAPNGKSGLWSLMTGRRNLVKSLCPSTGPLSHGR